MNAHDAGIGPNRIHHRFRRAIAESSQLLFQPPLRIAPVGDGVFAAQAGLVRQLVDVLQSHSGIPFQVNGDNHLEAAPAG